MYVSQLNTFGKVEPDCAVINGHKAPVQDISFSPFHAGLMATGSNDSTVSFVLLFSVVFTKNKYFCSNI